MGLKHKGRAKGTQNKRTKLVEEIAERLKVDPFEIMMLYAKGDWKALGYESEVILVESGEGDGSKISMKYIISPELRSQNAQAAARYLYAHKQAVDPATGDAGIRVIIEDYSKKDKE